MHTRHSCAAYLFDDEALRADALVDERDVLLHLHTPVLEHADHLALYKARKLGVHVADGARAVLHLEPRVLHAARAGRGKVLPLGGGQRHAQPLRGLVQLLRGARLALRVRGEVRLEILDRVLPADVARGVRLRGGGAEVLGG